MVLKRKVTEQLLRWKETSDKALLVTGARQIGKSFSIREFGKSNYKTYFEANLLLDKDAQESLPHASNASDFISRIALLSKNQLIEGNSLIFIDEIQEFPEIVTLLKALVEDGRFSYVFTGSMLGTEFKGISSFPVGSVKRIVMRPLDFQEFCWAIGVSDETLESIHCCMVNRSIVPDYMHRAMIKNFNAFVIAGGMPEVVQDYIDSSYSLIRTRQIQRELVEQYRVDISKYAQNQALSVRAIFDSLPNELLGENHRFLLSSLRNNARFENYSEDFLWLKNAGVGLVVPRSTEARIPLRRTIKQNYFKLYQSDTGMLVARYPQSTAQAIFLQKNTQNLGGIYENVVAQELLTQGIDPYYYYSSDIGEVDFVIEGRGESIVPIEVKSGRKVHSHSALDNLIHKHGDKIAEGIVLTQKNTERQEGVTYLPFYMTPYLHELTESENDAAGFTFSPATI